MFIFQLYNLAIKYVQSLKVPVICFPRGIKDYKEYCDIIKPDAICIDYEIDPVKISKEIKILSKGAWILRFYLQIKKNKKRGKKIFRYI